MIRKPREHWLEVCGRKEWYGATSDVQCNFIPGRQAVDNVILAQEVLLSLKRKKRKKKEWLVVKIDLEKATTKLVGNFRTSSCGSGTWGPFSLFNHVHSVFSFDVTTMEWGTFGKFYTQKMIETGWSFITVPLCFMYGSPWTMDTKINGFRRMERNQAPERKNNDITSLLYRWPHSFWSGLRETSKSYGKNLFAFCKVFEEIVNSKN